MSVNLNQIGRIGVLMGGYSSEREISLKSGQAIFKALKEEGCDVVSLDITDRLEDKIGLKIQQANIDVAFIALHGRLGEDGTIQSILEKLNISYTGSNVQASQRAINKVTTQTLFKKNGIPVAEHIPILRKRIPPLADILNRCGAFPLVVKPACEGSSIGVSVVANEKELNAALQLAAELGNEILVERYIQGRELTVGILNEKSLCVIEIVSQHRFFDFTAKYQAGLTTYSIPAFLPEDLTLKIQQIALAAHQVLGCQDFSRVDFILGEDSQFYVLEVNTIPGFTATSLLPKAAQYAGIGFNQLCLNLTQLAYDKKKKETTATDSLLSH